MSNSPSSGQENIRAALCGMERMVEYMCNEVETMPHPHERMTSLLSLLKHEIEIQLANIDDHEAVIGSENKLT